MCFGKFSRRLLQAGPEFDWIRVFSIRSIEVFLVIQGKGEGCCLGLFFEDLRRAAGSLHLGAGSWELRATKLSTVTKKQKRIGIE